MAAWRWRRLSGSCGAIAIAVLGVTIGGCGKSEVNVAVEPERPPVDPRYATAEAFIEHCQQLNQAGLAAYRELPSLLYAETEVQQRVLNLIGSSMAFFDLVIALDERFKLPIPPEMRDEVAILGRGELRVVQTLDRRVIAELRGKSAGPKLQQVHFVEYDGRWWLSGYTFEYDPNFKKLIDDPRNLEMAEMIMPMFNAPAASVAGRLRAGEFRTPMEALEAFRIAVFEQSQRTPALQHQIEQFMRENRDLFPLGSPAR